MSNEKAIEELEAVIKMIENNTIYLGIYEWVILNIRSRIAELRNLDESNVKAMAKKIIDDHKEGFEYLKGK